MSAIRVNGLSFDYCLVFYIPDTKQDISKYKIKNLILLNKHRCPLECKNQLLIMQY